MNGTEVNLGFVGIILMIVSGGLRIFSQDSDSKPLYYSLFTIFIVGLLFVVVGGIAGLVSA